MDDKNIKQWLKLARESGLNETQIQKQLQKSGWTKQQINNLYAPVPEKNANNKKMFPASTGSLISIGDQINFTWQTFKQHWKPLAGISALSFGFVILVLIMVTIIVASGFLASSSISSTDTYDSWGTSLNIFSFLLAGGVLFFLIMLIVPIINFLIQTWVQSSLTAAVTNLGCGISFKDAAAKGWKKMWSLLWINFLSGLISAGPLFIIIIIWIIVIALTGNSSQNVIEWIFGFLMLLAYIWVFASSGYLVYSPFVLFTEDARGSKALKRSFSLVKGYWWQVMLRNILFGIIISAISAVSIITIVGPLAVAICAVPLMMIYIFALFNNIRHLKQNA